MILSVSCGCCGMNIRDIDGLVLILNVRMNSDFDSLVLHRLKCNYCSSCDCRCVKLEYDINASFCLFSSESSACGDRFTINQNCFAGCLVHQGSAYCVLFARKQ